MRCATWTNSHSPSPTLRPTARVCPFFSGNMPRSAESSSASTWIANFRTCSMAWWSWTYGAPNRRFWNATWAAKRRRDSKTFTLLIQPIQTKPVSHSVILSEAKNPYCACAAGVLWRRWPEGISSAPRSFPGPQLGYLSGQLARLPNVNKSGSQLFAQSREFVCMHEFLQLLKQLALFLADVSRETPRERGQVWCRRLVRFCPRETRAQLGMVGNQFLHQRNQCTKPARRRKQYSFLRGKMNADLILKVLCDLRLPRP